MSTASSPGLTRAQTAALVAAFLGWMFDGFEMGLFPLIGKPALTDLLPGADPLIVTNWFNVIIATFLVGAATGGVLFGWLGDRVGRVRAMSISIFTYAIFTGLCGFATEAWHIAILRFIASLGMGGEWALGVALVNELWTKGSRLWVAGAIGAAANIGYLLVAFLSLGLNSYPKTWMDWFLGMGMSEPLAHSLFDHNAWRFLMIIGAVPAILIFFIRIFVPESEKWQEEKKAGTTSHWSNTDLIGVGVGGLAAMLIIWAWSPMGVGASQAALITVAGLGGVLWGYLYPVRSYLARADLAGALGDVSRAEVLKNMLLGALLAGVALLGTWGAAQQAPKWSTELAANGCQFPREYTQLATSFGAILATFTMPLFADMLGRRLIYTLACALALGSSVLFYQTNGAGITNWFFISAFLVGGLSASFYGFFPLYFPELFPTRVRATGQGFCFNVGRILAAVGSLQLANLVAAFGSSANAYTTLCMIYIVGMVVVWFAPETRRQALR